MHIFFLVQVKIQWKALFINEDNLTREYPESDKLDSYNTVSKIFN